eukprot:sb/3461158/
MKQARSHVVGEDNMCISTYYYSRTPIYRAPIYRNPDLPGDKVPPIQEINGYLTPIYRTPRFTGQNPFPQDPGKSGPDCNSIHICRQPFTFGQYTGMTNGEIYNHKALEEDHKIEPVGRSDCELIPALFEKVGTDLPKLLNGMFATVVVDNKSGNVFIARDHMGIIPLYWGSDSKGRLYVSSEQKCLVGVCERVENFPPRCYYHGPPTMGAVTQWYTMDHWVPAPFKGVEEEEVYDRVYNAMYKAVERMLPCDCPNGVLLSGGLDSSLVAAFTRKILGPDHELHTFTIGLENAPDFKFARAVADHIGSIHHEFKYSLAEGIDLVPEVIKKIETPHTTTVRSSTPNYLLGKKIHSLGFKMVLSGEGSDEAWGGYLYFHYAPNNEEFEAEMKDKLELLHYYDCLRANKSMLASSVEVRVPFLDPDLLDVAMTIPIEMKYPKFIKYNGRPIEKGVLRKACDRENLLPASVLWRQKEQFSDSVGYGWIDGLKEHYGAMGTTESEYYHSVYQKLGYADNVLLGGKTVACSTERGASWVPEGTSKDDSGRSVAMTTEEVVDSIAGKPSPSYVILWLVLMSFNAVCALVAYFPNFGGYLPYTMWRCSWESEECFKRLENFTDTAIFGSGNPEDTFYLDSYCSVVLAEPATRDYKMALLDVEGKALGELTTKIGVLTISSGNNCTGEKCTVTVDLEGSVGVSIADCRLEFPTPLRDNNILICHNKDNTTTSIDLDEGGEAVVALENCTSNIRFVQFVQGSGYNVHCPDKAQYNKDTMCRQPFTFGQYTGMTNGEIYNHKALEEDHKIEPVGRSDCELIPALFEKVGTDLPKLLNGMFATVVVDNKSGNVFIARDHMGIIPLYWGSDSKGRLYVSSEQKCLVGVCERVENFPPRCYYHGPPTMGAVTQWYTMDHWVPAPFKGVEEEEVYDRVYNAMYKAVERMLPCDCPSGVLLSGGLDSSLVAAFTRKILGPDHELHTFTIGLENAPDFKFARAVADHIGSIHHEFKYSLAEGIDLVPEVIRKIETPHTTTVRSSTPNYLLGKKIHSLGFKMVLSGEGSDEAWGGYLYFHYAPNNEEFEAEMKDKLELLHYYDCLRANKSMLASSVEVRVPFLDPDLLDVAMTIPIEMKYPKFIKYNGRPIEKGVLRKACDRENLLPASVLWRQKEQFSDSVGYGWIDGLKEHYGAMGTTECEYYHSVYQKLGYADNVLLGGKTVACSTERGASWVPEGTSKDDSGRSVAMVHESTRMFFMHKTYNLQKVGIVKIN